LQGIILEATDLEMSLRLQLPGADDDLNLAVPAKTLAEVVASLASESINLSVEIGKLLVTAQGVKSRIATQDADEYPPFPNCDHTLVTFKAAQLKTALKKVVVAASNDMARPVLNAVQICQRNDQITFAAADGFRLAVQEIPGKIDFPTGGKTSLLVPAPSVRKLIALLPDDADEIVSVLVNQQSSQIGFAWGGSEVFVGLLDGNFPDWSAIIPGTFVHRLALPADFAGAVRSAEVFGKLAGHVLALRPDENGKLLVVGSSTEDGESRTSLEIPMPFQVGFNAIFMSQGLEAIGTQAHLHLNAPAGPAMLTNGSHEFRYLIMPLVLSIPAAVDSASAAAEKSAAVAAESQG
jgi:DNA polymerase-3 subunit beta